MDEPTAALGVRESRKVLDLIAHLRASGTGIVVNCVAIAILLRIDFENRYLMRGKA